VSREPLFLFLLSLVALSLSPSLSHL